MDIKIRSCLESAKKAEGITVVIDVFRASNTIIACLASGVEYILPVGKLNEAYRLKQERPDHLLFGEREGLPPEGFDYGNSPAEAVRLNLRGKKIILTTSAGSQGIVHSAGAEEILIGSFANAQAIIDYLKNKQPGKVTLLAIGESAKKPATEDEACAEYIKSKLEGGDKNIESMKQLILRSDGADRLRRLHQQDDLEFCLKLDIYNIIPKFDRTIGKIIELPKIFPQPINK